MTFKDKRTLSPCDRLHAVVVLASMLHSNPNKKRLIKVLKLQLSWQDDVLDRLHDELCLTGEKVRCRGHSPSVLFSSLEADLEAVTVFTQCTVQVRPHFPVHFCDTHKGD